MGQGKELSRQEKAPAPALVDDRRMPPYGLALGIVEGAVQWAGAWRVSEPRPGMLWLWAALGAFKCTVAPWDGAYHWTDRGRRRFSSAGWHWAAWGQVRRPALVRQCTSHEPAHREKYRTEGVSVTYACASVTACVLPSAAARNRALASLGRRTSSKGGVREI